ncbi:MAG: UDP-N-acetylglucosamine 2-epimerase (hydrolyzing) [Planctomycetes bacterium TMED75]|nr:UDP-N-acetylglucosamine 2-epimerase (hydrolyzing) [Planctomycetaceae bacterium]OUU90657.1 MAG: UDP-N-acetylglucosamine 2-epimerase (hydrolyzing) [Planctomycetes bacterium TMED75]
MKGEYGSQRESQPVSIEETNENRTVAIVSSSRADLAHLVHPLRALVASDVIEPTVLATGALLQDEFGSSVGRLAEESIPFESVPCDLEIQRGVDAARAIGHATIAFADVLDRIQPDLLMVVADRFEMLAPANAALAMKIPIIHVEGGERSEGAIDDAVRNALTKMAHLHLVTTEAARRRVMAMGEEPWRVHRVGAGSLDHFLLSRLPDARELEARLGIPEDGALILAAVHPVTLQKDPTADALALIDALSRRTDPTETIFFAFPNADEGSRIIRDAVQSFVQRRPRVVIRTNLDPETWLGLMHRASVVVGNSSSVLMETPSVPVPAVCIGRRQEGRERAANIVDCPAEPTLIADALEQASRLTLKGVENPYGDGNASIRIRQVLESAPQRQRLLDKSTTLLD